MNFVSHRPGRVITISLIFAITAILFTACGVTTETGSVSPATQPQEAKRGTAIGQMAPDFEIAKNEGGNISFSDLKGNPAVLVFWTAWCPVCKEEAPHINTLAAEFEPAGVKVVGINIGESDARVSEGIKDFGIKYTVARDKDASVAGKYKVVGTPTVVILDKSGVVQYFGNELPKDAAERLKALITS